MNRLSPLDVVVVAGGVILPALWELARVSHSATAVAGLSVIVRETDGPAVRRLFKKLLSGARGAAIGLIFISATALAVPFLAVILAAAPLVTAVGFAARLGALLALVPAIGVPGVASLAGVAPVVGAGRPPRLP